MPKFPRLKARVQSLGKNAKGMLSDIIHILPDGFADIREHNASLKRYEEWLASQETTETPVEDAQ